MRRYSAARSSTLAGVCIQMRMVRAPKTPTTVSSTPLMMLRSMEVMYGFVEFLFITGAVVFGSQRIGAHGKADEEVGQKTDEGGVGAHGGQ